LSAFLSSSEVALFSLTKLQIRQIKDQFKKTHVIITRLLKDPGGLLITILIANEFVNVGLATIITNTVLNNWEDKSVFVDKILSSQFLSRFPDWTFQIILGLLITTPIILFFCEITPKVIGVKINQLIAPLTAEPLSWIYLIFKPIRFILKIGIKVFLKFLGHKKPVYDISPRVLKEEEFLSIVEEGHKDGSILESELELIKNVFDLDDITVKDIYTPLHKTITLSENTTLGKAMKLIQGKSISRIPIFENKTKQIIGILSSKELLEAKINTSLLTNPVSTIMNKPFFVGSNLKLSFCLRRLRQNKTRIAVVRNTSGESIGIIKINDILHSLFDDLLEKQKSLGAGP